MKKVNVLITSAGVATAVNVIAALRRSSLFDCRIIATDMSDHAVGLYLADTWYLTGKAGSENFEKEIFDIITKEKIDFVFPMFSAETQFFAERRNLLHARNVGITIPDSDVVSVCNNKNAFLDFLQKENFPFPRAYTSIDEVKHYPVFVKPVTGSSSKNAKKISNYEEYQYHAEHCTTGLIIQDYIDWKEVTVDCYVNKNGRLVGCVPRYRTLVKEGKSMVATTFKDEGVRSVVKSLLSKLKLTGACNVQLFYKEKEVMIVEVNPRLAAGGLPLTIQSGVNIPELMMLDYFGSVSDELIDFKDGLTMYRYLTEIFI